MTGTTKRWRPETKRQHSFRRYGVHHSDLSRLIASCGDKISDRWSWARKCETALKLTGRFSAA